MSKKCIGFLAVFVALAAGCTVHHHHHYPEESVAENPDPPKALDTSDSDPHEDQFVDHSDTESSASETKVERHVNIKDRPLPFIDEPPRTPPPAWEPVSFIAATGPLTHCEVSSYETGWVVAECPDARLLLQTGPASRGNHFRLFSYAGDLASSMATRPSLYKGDRGKVKLGGTSLETTEFRLQAMKESAFGGFTSDPNGEVVGQGIFTIGRTERGKTGMLCVQEGSYDRNRCIAYFQELTSGSMRDIGVNEGNTLQLAGATLKSEEECYFLRPEELGCPSGGLTWKRGREDTVANLVDTTLQKWTDTHGVKGFHNPHLKSQCRIDGRLTTCHEVRFQGVLKTAAEIRHAAQIPQDMGSLALICTYSTSDSAPKPCRQFFQTIDAMPMRQREIREQK